MADVDVEKLLDEGVEKKEEKRSEGGGEEDRERDDRRDRDRDRDRDRRDRRDDRDRDREPPCIDHGTPPTQASLSPQWVLPTTLAGDRDRRHREYDGDRRDRDRDRDRRDRDRDDERPPRRARTPSPDPVEREREEAMRSDLTVLVQRIHPRADDFEIFEFFSQVLRCPQQPSLALAAVLSPPQAPGSTWSMC